MAFSSIPSRVFRQAAERPDHPAYAVRDARGWHRVSWQAYAEEVRDVARALAALGVQRGDRVCILGRNRPEWVVADVAAMALGAVPAGIYATCSSEEVAWILGHAEAVVAVVEDQAQWRKVAERWEGLPALRHVVLMRGAEVDDPRTLTWEALIQRRDEVPPERVEDAVRSLAPDQPATFIYTSGTTGPPKAVTLTHDNLAFTADLACRLVAFEADDHTLSYLPLSHIAEQMFTIHGPSTVGATVFYSRGMEHLAEDLREVQPTVFFGVPRVWEKFHAALAPRLAEATGLKRRIVDWAMAVGREATERRNAGRRLGPALALRERIAERLLFDKVRPLIGLGRARICVSGAAPISPEILRFFAGLGIVIHEVYGQSEDTGPTTFNRPGRTRFGSVGVPLEGVEVRIADDGEILVRGRNVFAGYFKDPEATAETLRDGWLHSGDLGRFDEDGFLHITGRKKDIIITAGGKNIAPKNIEAALADIPLVAQAVVIGDRRKYLTALLTLDPEAVARLAASVGAEGLDHDAPELRVALQEAIDAVNARFARVEHIRRFAVLPRPFTQEDGELTPTLKIKRRVVEANWAETIDALYRD